jgi:uncharacterized protein YcbK (DUF882 family)
MRRRLLRLKVWPAFYALLAACGVVQLYRPEPAHGRTADSFVPDSTTADLGSGGFPLSLGRPSAAVFGRSGEVKVLVALPGEEVDFPLDRDSDAPEITYEWTSLRGIDVGFDAQPISGSQLNAPNTPGFYYLTLVRGERREILSEPAVAVLRPFEEKQGATLNGYRIGTYGAERAKGKRRTAHPEGFLEVYPQHIDLPLSRHFRVRDFITQDDQANVWPKYVAISPRLLDKLELVFARLERDENDTTVSRDLRLDVKSGFRTPSHNRRVRRAARDSRHQYGDAADVGVDANGNGRIDRGDWRLLVKAIDAVERSHPDLVGGLGIYNSRRYASPYVHVDVRGKRSRWRG